MKKINFLEKLNDKLKNMYRFGKSVDMNNRKKNYNTHTIYKKKIILKKEVL